jgi:hypothetical protein
MHRYTRSVPPTYVGMELFGIRERDFGVIMIMILRQNVVHRRLSTVHWHIMAFTCHVMYCIGVGSSGTWIPLLKSSVQVFYSHISYRNSGLNQPITLGNRSFFTCIIYVVHIIIPSQLVIGVLIYRDSQVTKEGGEPAC